MIVALGAALAAVSGWRYARASAPVNGPIILLSIDALRADHLPAYGYKGGSTVAIDALAKDGIVFERAYSHVPQTLPAHAALLTGRLPFENGVRDSVGFTMNASERSLAEMLGDRGYSTAGVVSSFLLRKETGISQGFTLFDSTAAKTPGLEPALVRDSADAETVAERWFDSAGTTRAFLFLHLAEPSSDETGDPAISTYDARVTKADQSVGRLVTYLKEHQLYDQSTIILVSDHGQGLGEHGEAGHGLSLNNDVLHTPLIIKQAAGADAGHRVKTPVQQIDIVPTVLDLAKAPIPGNLRGRSLTSLFDDGTFDDERMIYAESLFGRYHFGWEALTAVTDGHFLYTDGAAPQLIDLDTDATAASNLVEKRPELVSKFRKALAEFSATSPLPPMADVSAADRARFERLGYVGTPERAAATVVAVSADAANVAVVEQYRAAARIFASGALMAAIDAFKKLTAMAPTSRDAWLHLAVVAARAESLEASADAYRHAIDLAPASADGYLGAANALLRLRRFDDARSCAQQVIDGEMGGASEKGAAHELLARAALGRRNYEVARKEAAFAEEAVAGRPVVAYVNGRIALDQRRYDDAFTAFETASAVIDEKKQAPLADLRLYTAEALIRAERLSEAEYLFLEQLKDAPLSPRALAGLATIYKATGRTDEATALAQH